MYHDIVESENWKSSGFAGSDADIYKLDRNVFAAHLERLKINNISPKTVFEAINQPNQSDVLMTFDDGGESAYTDAAELLEKFNWRGHFFVATDFIDSATFLKRKQIRELHNRGHIIGSHSASHPTRMANCTRSQMINEWQESVKKLSDIIGDSVTVASVPGGYYSTDVAKTASECGIKFLFNSEPTTQLFVVDKCKVLGRYTIQQSLTIQQFDKLSQGDSLYQFQQYALWNAKKIVKKLGGKTYLEIRKRILDKQ